MDCLVNLPILAALESLVQPDLEVFRDLLVDMEILELKATLDTLDGSLQDPWVQPE